MQPQRTLTPEDSVDATMHRSLVCVRALPAPAALDEEPVPAM